MPGTKEIRTKIASVKSTQKITKAMEMVAASKMRRAQERMRLARPYADKIRTVVGHLNKANPDYKHPFLVEREAKHIGVIIVSSDRGLCGALNTNVFKSTLGLMREWQGKDAKVSLCVLGSKGLAFFRRLGLPILASTTGLGDKPRVDQLVGPVKVMLDGYIHDRFDRLLIIYTKFVNTMKQEALVEQVLPLAGDALGTPAGTWDYIYEPDAKVVLDQILARYIEALIYQSVAENMASEQSARMVAMKAASDNAGSVIDELTLIYNKTRQASITKELSEIVGGAAAV